MEWNTPSPPPKSDAGKGLTASITPLCGVTATEKFNLDTITLNYVAVVNPISINGIKHFCLGLFRNGRKNPVAWIKTRVDYWLGQIFVMPIWAPWNVNPDDPVGVTI